MSTNPNVKIMSVACGLRPLAYKHWEYSAKAMGYDYQIYGRDVTWRGFNTKIRLCEQYVRELDANQYPIVCITDCTDVFFCASAATLVANFLALNCQVIVGAEAILHYVKGRKAKSTVEQQLRDINIQRRGQLDLHCFPNGGMIMGYTTDLRKLYSLILEAHDDQAAYCDTISDHLFNITIDYEGRLFGNIPNYQRYHQYHHITDNYYYYDVISRKIQVSHQSFGPAVLHFPGSNFKIRDKLYQEVFNFTYDKDTPTSLVVRYVIIILLIIYLLVILSSPRRLLK